MSAKTGKMRGRREKHQSTTTRHANTDRQTDRKTHTNIHRKEGILDVENVED